MDQGGVWMYATPEHLEAEVVDRTYRELNLHSLVYVTSSHDPSIPPGIHRLLDLDVFADEETCATVASARCRSEDWSNPTKTRTWYTTLMPAVDYVPRGFVSGIDMFVRARYHEQVPRDFPGVAAFDVDVYNGLPGCRSTEIVGTYMQYKGTESPVGISIKDLINRLNPRAPPPSASAAVATAVDAAAVAAAARRAAGLPRSNCASASSRRRRPAHAVYWRTVDSAATSCRWR